MTVLWQCCAPLSAHYIGSVANATITFYSPQTFHLEVCVSPWLSTPAGVLLTFVVDFFAPFVSPTPNHAQL